MDKAIKTYGSLEKLPEIKEKGALFLCTIASTLTSHIPGITGAGATPELTDYTPAADMELIVYGEPRCLPEIPQTIVDGSAAPTPAVITKAALELADIPFLVVDAGAAVKPNLPYIKVNEEPGSDIKTGRAVSNPQLIYEQGKVVGEILSRLTGHMFIGESTPAGTTTALGVLQALGYDAWGKVSGSTPENPHHLKEQLVKQGLMAAGIYDQELQDPFQAVMAVGDPMIPAVAGIAAGSKVPVTLAGGTQMTAVCALLKAVNPLYSFDDLSLATTIFIARDETSDINYLTSQIDDIPIIAVDPFFERSENESLKNYLNGSVKEGAGAGGAMLAALLMDNTMDDIRAMTENLCKEIF